ncbi:MAG: amino acid ABC transporter substrate-binding protein [Streptosporangiales bacterium]|nr:amino acid ABC transporter substrate-binding protein [Streptosporangiales bacterium]
MPGKAPRKVLGPIVAVASLALAGGVLAGCAGGGDAFEEGEGQGGKRLTIASAQFSEQTILAHAYAALLEKAGYQPEVQVVQSREVYEPSMENGQVHVAPEYAATLLEFLNGKQNGPDAKPLATGDVETTVQRLRPLAEKAGLTVLEPSQAVDQNYFVVRKQFAGENNLRSLSDLGKLDRPIVLAAGDDCKERPFCYEALTETYGIDIEEVKPLGVNTLPTKEAVQKGDADLGLSLTTDATLQDLGLVGLADDKQTQLADYVVPVVSAKSAGDPKIEQALNKLSDVLTTEDLTELNRRVDVEREKPETVARDYLQSKGLI